MEDKEKILILGSLFHDIGKFEQRCANIRKRHTDLGGEFADSLKDEFTKLLSNDENNFDEFRKIIVNHHWDNKGLVKYCRMGDHLSASERVEKAENEEPQETWSHHFLASIFAKVNLLKTQKVSPRYFKHKLLDKTDADVLIPEYSSEIDAKADNYKYSNQGEVFGLFTEDVKSVLKFYKDDNDFKTIINLLLIVFEKYMWCIPDFTGSDQTDISLYNHSKDVSAISNALYYADNENELCLVVGEMPGIQNYIFDVTNRKPAKILRGRSIFVQVLTRNFASIFLNELGLTDANLVMFAGGKFYILAPHNDEFIDRFNSAKSKVEQYLIDNFSYELKFAVGYTKFNYSELKDKNVTFGEIIEKASYNLLNNRNKVFYNDLFSSEGANDEKFIQEVNYTNTNSSDSNNIKCLVTEKPIREGRDTTLEEENEQVDIQVKNEYKIGKEILYGTVIIELDEEFKEVLKVEPIDKYKAGSNSNKIILNPNLEQLLNYQDKSNLLKNAQFIEIANYASLNQENNVMSFEEIAEYNFGAEYLTLIKGDIDNLGLIMSLGLADDDNDLTSISRTTTLSNQLKYFFSFFINGFLEKWTTEASNDNELPEKDQKVYTVFAGGDDLMLVTTQSASLKLLNIFNNKFNDFICDNPEIHISYSLTNFKHHTPIRIVSNIAENNQDEAKKIDELDENYLDNPDSFDSYKNKSSVRLFDRSFKNFYLEDLLFWKNKLEKWIEMPNYENPLTSSTLYNIQHLSIIMDGYYEKGKTDDLIYHPLLTYLINRNLKSGNNYSAKFDKDEFAEFFDSALDIKLNSDFDIKKILTPVVKSVIYTLRK